MDIHIFSSGVKYLTKMCVHFLLQKDDLVNGERFVRYSLHVSLKQFEFNELKRQFGG